MNLLEQLKTYTRVVADTGDFSSIEIYKPVDATTNPSLIYAASQDARYKHLIDDAIDFARRSSSDKSERLSKAMDKLAVNFGLEILKIVPGRASTEVDARLSFDTEATVAKAREIIGLYESAGISRERVLVKIASTWEGIKAAEIVEKEGIHCNLTLLFSQVQAIACAEAGVRLISPFVGRILDWHKKDRGVPEIPATEDPGVISVTGIFNYYKKFGYPTQVMGASFRNIGEICELAGCDLLTISPSLLKELEATEGTLAKKLDAEKALEMDIGKITVDEKTFRWMMNEDAMATEKLAEGIRNFTKDLIKLEKQIEKLV
ncbi:MAG TPA: transaldolase [Petrimonas sp.]|uniref:transaldolase n=1 Tax=Petrimonas sp. TaxID=2023866 RepID=UPI000964067D|nr:transaldolase [Petrimonas sp.]MEA5063799.1 transaldolase [Petrimonas sp.]OJV33588.1 MAG: transaldolase [Bacteroidia bacterium 43-41]HHV84799.1 transaldolase [Petrimonas sp.]